MLSSSYIRKEREQSVPAPLHYRLYSLKDPKLCSHLGTKGALCFQLSLLLSPESLLLLWEAEGLPVVPCSVAPHQLCDTCRAPRWLSPVWWWLSSSQVDSHIGHTWCRTASILPGVSTAGCVPPVSYVDLKSIKIQPEFPVSWFGFVDAAWSREHVCKNV